MAEAKTDQDEQTTSVDNPTADFLGDDEARNFAVEGNDLNGYIGVSPEYMTYADETHRPLSTDEEHIPTVEQLQFEEEEEGEVVEDEKTASDSKKEEPKTATQGARTGTSTATATKSAAPTKSTK